MKQQETAYICDGELPGVRILNGTAYGEAGGRWWPVSGLLRTRDGDLLPVLDIPQMEEGSRREAAGGKARSGSAMRTPSAGTAFCPCTRT